VRLTPRPHSAEQVVPAARRCTVGSIRSRAAELRARRCRRHGLHQLPEQDLRAQRRHGAIAMVGHGRQLSRLLHARLRGRRTLRRLLRPSDLCAEPGNRQAPVIISLQRRRAPGGEDQACLVGYGAQAYGTPGKSRELRELRGIPATTSPSSCARAATKTGASGAARPRRYVGKRGSQSRAVRSMVSTACGSIRQSAEA
jgi:hypothetical protein